MRDYEKVFLGAFVGFFLGLFAPLINGIEDSKIYRKGQVDALTGKIYYELVIHPDSTKTWEFIEEEE